MGDPAVDAGNFLAHLTEQSLRIYGRSDALMDCEQSFEEKFLELTPETSRESVRAYRMFTLARHIYLSTLFHDRRPYTQTFLEICEKELYRADASRPPMVQHGAH